MGGNGKQQPIGQKHGDVQQQLGCHDGRSRVIALRDPDEGLQIQVMDRRMKIQRSVEENSQVQQRCQGQPQDDLAQVVQPGMLSKAAVRHSAIGSVGQAAQGRQQGKGRGKRDVVSKHSEYLLVCDGGILPQKPQIVLKWKL